MLMTTPRLILMRLFQVSLGRLEFFARAARRFLERKLVWQAKGERYGATSRYFDLKDLGPRA